MLISFFSPPLSLLPLKNTIKIHLLITIFIFIFKPTQTEALPIKTSTLHSKKK